MRSSSETFYAPEISSIESIWFHSFRQVLNSVDVASVQAKQSDTS